ncbi:MAG: ABC transporter ATP-binding protein [Paracoccaceae bacterium]|nr:ABC transporter ATP-binding protein [Paracoccaceae bacterium]
MAEILLQTAGLSHSFGHLKAVDAVNLSIRRGTITGLIGPNGAGKSTLFNLLTGAIPCGSGHIKLGEEDVTALPPDIRFSKGLGRTFQIPRPFARMSVLENIMVAPTGQVGERIAGPFFNRARVREQERAIRARALEVLDFVTLGALADHPAGKISGGQMKLLELARVLMGDPQVILLDEPAAGVNPSLTQVLIEKIEELNRQGKTFVIIEHDMDFVMRHCDPVIALDKGRIVFEGTAAEAQDNPVLREAYLGAMAHA